MKIDTVFHSSSWKVILSILFFTSISIAGCGGGSSSSTDNEDVGAVDCAIDNPPLICESDADGDGMPYSLEIAGWEVWPDRFGLGQGADTFGQMDAHYVTTSNPDVADSDDDGLDDFREFLNKTDPNLKDTDGDGLTDKEELERWKTNPLSIDTDGDSRGPDKDLQPNSVLFDSAELKIDLINDPAHNPGVGATSPLHVDTDGDGWSDWEEIVEKTGEGFKPTIADVPLTRIEITTSPIIRLTGDQTTTNDWSREVAISDAIATSVSSESSMARGTEQVIENTVGVGAELGFEAGADGMKFVGNISGSASINYSYASSMATSHSVSWTQGQSLQAETVYQESSVVGGSEAVTLTGGYISLPIDLVNTGNVSFTLSDLRINVLARYLNGSSEYTPVLELSRINNDSFTLAPGESNQNILMQSDTDDYELIRSFLKNPSGLMFEVSSYSLKDADDQDFAFAEENIKQKTAAVIIDYGGERSPESYLAAVLPLRSATADGISMATVMDDIIEVTYQTSIESTQNGAPYQVLSSIRDISNEPGLNKRWLVTTTSASLDNFDTVDFEDIVLQAGDTIFLMYVKDQDGDGLSAREEFLHSTSDANTDTDDDGLTDFEEVRLGWSVQIEGHPAYDVQSRGYNADSDSDNLGDAFERHCGLDPLLSDTDQDGISDYDELYGFQIPDFNGSGVALDVVPYSGNVILDGGNAAIDTLVAAGDDVAINGPISAGDIVISAGVDEILQSTATPDDYIGVNHIALDCEPAGYATNPLNIDTDGESTPDGVELQYALGSPNNPNDSSVYVDTDNDGLSDAVEIQGFSSLVNGQNANMFSDPNDLDGDSDDDGLPDLLEYMLKSDPQLADTDGDGIGDFYEYDFVNQFTAFKTACDSAAGCIEPDPNASMDYEVGLNLNHWDTDDDGLNDRIEVDGWDIHIDGALVATRHVYTNSAVDKEDFDNDGLDDAEEYNLRTDPQAIDSDNDGKSDGDELNVQSDFGQRDPTYWDRKITILYDYVKFDGECDQWGDLVEVEWLLGARAPGLPNDIEGLARLYSSGLDPVDPINVGPVLSTTFPVFQKDYLGGISFIANRNETFELYGYVKEIDRANLFSTSWDASDGGMYFHDPACDDCKEVFVKDVWDDLGNMVEVTESLRYTVTDSLTIGSTSRILQASQQCWRGDNGFQIVTLGFPIPISMPFTVTVKATVTVEN